MATRKRKHPRLTERTDSVESLVQDGENLPSNAHSTEPYVFQDKKHQAICLSGFHDMYEKGQLFDLTLTVDGEKCRCHKALLASSSDYFRCMFTTDLAEREMDSVPINGVDAASMRLVLNYLYSGEVRLQADTVQNLLSAANLFQLHDLKEGCACYMAKQLDEENCIGIHFFAQAHDCQKLETQAWDVIGEHFEEVSNCQEFLELTEDKLVEIIMFDDIQASEEDVFDACRRWVEHSPDMRSQQVFSVMKHVRFALLDEYFLYDQVSDNKSVVSVELQNMLQEVIRYRMLKNRWMESDLRVEPRYGASFSRVVVYTSYLDDEKKQVLQLYGQRSDEVTRLPGNVLCDIPSDIENPAVLVTGDNDMYVAGGDGCGNALYKWYPDDMTFEELSAMNVPRRQFVLIQVDKCIYAVGGCNHEGNLRTVSRYSEELDEWDTVASMPKALRCFCACAYHGKLYVFGGEAEKTNKKMIRGKTELNRHTLCYDPREDKWSILAEMTTARALAGCTVFNNKIYVIGGFGSITESWIKDTSPDNVLDSVEIYDPATNSWEAGPDLPVPLCAMAVLKYYGTIYVLGGENEDDISYSVYYLTTDGTWELKDEMVTGVTETTIHSSYSILNIDIDLPNTV